MPYPHLFTPLTLGKVHLKNRLVMSQMTMNYASEEGYVTEKLIRHYVERAKGGVGLILAEGTFFTPEGRGYKNQLGLCSWKHVQGLRRLTDAVHGITDPPKIFIQIHHAGWRSSSKVSGLQPVGPSAMAPYPGAEVARSLSLREIQDLIEAHIAAAVMAEDAGFDGVDFHCAHGYLIPSFFSPLSNRRSDLYGGDLAGRTRFLTEVLRGVKEKLGEAFPVTIKISGDEFITEGLGLKEMVEIARMAEETGIDGILISAGTVGGKKEENPSQLHKVLRTLPMMTDPGCLVPLASEMKKALSIPVIAVGRIGHPALAEDIIARGQADLVAMGRALLADPHFPRKAFAGKEEEIRPCIACNEGCYKRIFQQLDIRCSVNPTLGREEETFCPPSPSPKRVVVIGGGPAGMEAAHAARERGHDVLLLEATDELGGQLKIASLPPGRKEIERFRQFLKNRLTRAGVKILQGEKASPALWQQHAPDVVIMASGAHPREISIRGLEQEWMISAWDVLNGQGNIQEPVLVLGAGLVGCETADLLSEGGRKVIIAEILPEIAPGQDGDTKAYFTLKFKKNGVEVLTGVKLKSVEGKTAILQRGPEELRILVGMVVCAVGAEPNEDLMKDLVSAGLKVTPTTPLSPTIGGEGGVRGKVIKIGDCVQPRTILEAVREGFEAGRAV